MKKEYHVFESYDKIQRARIAVLDTLADALAMIHDLDLPGAAVEIRKGAELVKVFRRKERGQ